MITITYSKNKIVAEGHTGQKGTSLLCCAVSVLMWGLVDALIREGYVPDVEADDGYQSTSYDGNDDGTVERLFKAYAGNLSSLSEIHPKEINFKKISDETIFLKKIL